MFRGRLWQAGQEVGVAVRVSFAVIECVIERGEELVALLDSGIMVPYFAYFVQCLVVGEYAEFGSLKVASEAFDSPNDAAGLQINRSPMPFRVERSSADIHDGVMEPSDCSCLRAAPNSPMQTSQHTWNGREPSATASPLGKTRICGVASSARIYRTNFSIAANLTPFRRSALSGRRLLDKWGKKIAVMVDTINQCTDLLHIRGHRHIG